MMGKRQMIRNRQGKAYRALNREIKKKCREAKNSQLNDPCAEIESRFYESAAG